MSGVADGHERVDPRVQRTRRLLQDALLTLARERSLDEISVADIADHATINRTTFYQHYPDTDTLLADALDAQAALVGADLSTIRPDAGPDETPEVLVRWASLVADHHVLYRRALGEHGSPVAVARLRRRIELLAIEGLARHDAPEVVSPPPEILAAALAGSLIGVIGAWLERDPLPPPSDAAAWAWAAVNGFPQEARRRSRG